MFFDVLKDFCESDLVQNNVAVFVVCIILVFLLGAGVMWLYMHFIKTQRVLNKCSEFKQKNEELSKENSILKSEKKALTDKNTALSNEFKQFKRKYEEFTLKQEFEEYCKSSDEYEALKNFFK